MDKTRVPTGDREYIRSVPIRPVAPVYFFYFFQHSSDSFCTPPPAWVALSPYDVLHLQTVVAPAAPTLRARCPSSQLAIRSFLISACSCPTTPPPPQLAAAHSPLRSSLLRTLLFFAFCILAIFCLSLFSSSSLLLSYLLAFFTSLLLFPRQASGSSASPYLPPRLPPSPYPFFAFH